MEFVIVHKDRVVAGPMSWRKIFFQDEIKELTGTDVVLPATNSDGRPFHIDDDTHILYFAGIVQTFPIDDLLDDAAGPFYTIFEDHCTCYYTPETRSLEAVKGTLKSKVPALRFNKEVSGFFQDFKGNKVFIESNRIKRNVFSDGAPGKWKFATGAQAVDPTGRTDVTGVYVRTGEVWLDVTTEDLAFLDGKLKEHVTNSFQWEHDKMLEIDALNTLEECKNYTY